MKSARIDDMVRGWFVGAFEPNVLHTDVAEVAVKRYSAGDNEELHHHRVAVELTAVISGEVRMCERNWTAGDIIRLDPGEATSFEALQDSVVVVVKVPGAQNDKYLGAGPVG